MSLLLSLAVWMLLLEAPGPMQAPALQTNGFGMVSFTQQPFGARKSKWRMEAFDDGTGAFYRFETPYPEKMPMYFHVATLQRFAAAQAAAKTRRCETKQKNVAQTGMKRIVFGLGPSALDCDFNYSDDSALNDAVSAFHAVAETIFMGDKLAHDKRFDHLGLNADLEALATEAKDGSAIELENIAPVLQSIADNEDLMDVVRRKAQSLLQDASINTPPAK